MFAEPSGTESSRKAANVPKSSSSKVLEFEHDEAMNQEKFEKSEDGFHYPDGGLKAWSVAIGAMLGMLPTWGLFFVSGTLENYISHHQLAHEHKSKTSWIFSVYACLVLSSGVISGLYFDKCGAKTPLAAGSLLFIGGIFATANCREVWQFVLAFGMCTGIGSGIICSPLLAAICHYFYKKRGIATAVAINGGSFGGVVFPLMFEKLFGTVGFPWSMRIMGGISICCLSLAWCLVREDPAKLLLDSDKDILRRSYHPVHRTLLNLKDSCDYKALATEEYFWCTIGTCLAEVASGATVTYISSYCAQAGYSNADSFQIVTVLNSLTIVGGLVFSVISDSWLGHYNVMVMINLLIGLCGFLIWLPFGSHHKSIMYIYASLFGLFYGSMLNLAPVCCGKICRTDEFGKRYSTMYLFVGLSFLIGYVVSGNIIGKGSLANYNNFIIFTSMLSCLSSIFYGISKCYALHRRATNRGSTSSSALQLSIVLRHSFGTKF